MRLTDLYRDHYGEVHGYFLLQVAEPHRAEELTQESFYQACRSFPSYRGEGSLKAWLFGIARNVLLKSRRETARSRELSVQPQEFRRLVAPGEQPADLLANREEAQQAWSALAALSGDYRTAIWLRDVAELDYDSISRILERSPGACRVLVFRARTQLRQAYEELQ